MADPAHTGDRPVYLARHRHIIGLLPIPNGASGWSYGYPGGSPHTLAAHIETFLRERGRLIDATALRDYLTNRERDHDGVDIDIAITACPAPSDPPASSSSTNTADRQAPRLREPPRAGALIPRPARACPRHPCATAGPPHH